MDQVADQIVALENWDELTDDQLDVLERKIAAKYTHIVPWGAVAWGIGNTLLWLSLWPLVLLDILPLWLGFIIATFNCALAYLPSHEAQHSIIAGKGKPLRWLNELVGHVSLIPFCAPFRVARATHMAHHRHTNDPVLDVDYDTTARNGWHFLYKSILRRQPGSKSKEAYPAALERTGQSHLMLDILIVNIFYLAVLFGMASTGHAIEAALLWWLPKNISMVYVEHYLSWMPHHPGKETSRYRDTRAFKSKLGNIGSMGMQYHIIHHLFPRIPLSQHPAVYREIKPILQRKGCDLGEL